MPDSIGDSPISPDTPTRPILGTEEEIVRVSNEGLWMRLMLGNTTNCCGTQWTEVVVDGVEITSHNVELGV